MSLCTANSISFNRIATVLNEMCVAHARSVCLRFRFPENVLCDQLEIYGCEWLNGRSSFHNYNSFVVYY